MATIAELISHAENAQLRAVEAAAYKAADDANFAATAARLAAAKAKRIAAKATKSAS